MSQFSSFSRRSFIVASLALVACKNKSRVLKLSGNTMGTHYNVIAVDHQNKFEEVELQVHVDKALQLVNAGMSNWDKNSEISHFNARQDLEVASVSDDLLEVMQAAQEVHLASEGRFDTTIGPLIDLWGFGVSGKSQLPSDQEIELALSQSGHTQNLAVMANGIQKINPNATVYLSAIGKGYGVDKVGKALEGMGLKDFMIEIGGDLYASGVNPDGYSWQIGIEKPAALSGGVFDVVGVSNFGLASSGDYRNYFEEDGKRFSHVIDPTTARPIDHVTASATVIAENSMLADAWATAMMVLGSERGLEIAEQNELAVVFIDRDVNANDLQFKTISSPQFNRFKA